MIRMLAAAVLAFSATAMAEEQPNPPPTEGAAGIEGQFVFNQADGKSRGCQVILFAEEEDGHFRADMGDCATQFEFLGDVASWDFTDDDTVQLIDEANKAVIELTPEDDTNALYRGKNPLDGREYYLERTSG